MKKLTTFILITLVVVACLQPQKKDGEFLVVSTTNIIGSIAEQILPDSIENRKVVYKTIMGAGVDPHLYKSKASDNNAFDEADLILYSGLHLEGKLSANLKKRAQKQKTIAFGELLPHSTLIKTSDFGGAHDPHFWFDVNLYQTAVTNGLDSLKNLFTHFDSSKGEKYLKELKSLDSWVNNELKKIPESQRVLITAHDAFGYFGKRYNIQVKGVQGVSTASESGIKAIVELVDFIIANKIKAVFIESSVSQRNINSIIEGCKQKGHNVKLGGTLFSDALGEPGSPEGYYIGMIHYNTTTIVNALK